MRRSSSSSRRALGAIGSPLTGGNPIGPPAAQSLIAFEVFGDPVAQGSKTAVPTAAGPRMRESNEKRLRPWRTAVAYEAEAAMDGREPIEGPLFVFVTFVLSRPKAHYRANGELKPSAPSYCEKRPDLDKLARSILDAGSRIVWRDDSQIAALHCAKVYGSPPGARIVVEPIGLLAGERIEGPVPAAPDRSSSVPGPEVSRDQ